MYLNNGWHRAVERYDLLLHYNEAIPVEEQVRNDPTGLLNLRA